MVTASFSPDGYRVVTASSDRTARVWNADTDTEVARLRRPEWDQWTVLSPDLARVVVIGSGLGAEIRDAATGRLQVALTPAAGVGDAARAAGVQHAAFSADGARVATASLDGMARVWDVATGRELLVLRHSHGLETVAFSPDGSRIATASRDSKARVWDAETGDLQREVGEHRGYMRAVVFSPDGGRLVTTSDLEQRVRLWDISSGELLRVFWYAAGWLHAALFDADGQRLLVVSKSNVMFVSDVSRGSTIATLEGHSTGFTGGAFAADASRLVTLHQDGSACVWDLPTGRNLVTVRSRRSRFVSATFADGGSTLRTISVDGVQRDWPLDPLPTACARSPRVPTVEDWARMNVGSDHRAEGHRSWIRQSVCDTVRLAERAWDIDRGNRDGLFQHGRMVRTALSILVRHESTVDRDAAGPPWSNGSSCLSFDVLRRAFRLLERAATLPDAPAEFRSGLEAARRAFRPHVFTFGGIDTAFDAADHASPIDMEPHWRLLRGVEPPSVGSEWTMPAFDDGAWKDVRLPVGYGRDMPPHGSRTVLSDMRDGYSTVFLRRRFAVGAPGDWRSLRLLVRHDDGFVAWLNGVEVFRSSAGRLDTTVPFDALATTGRRRTKTRTIDLEPQLLRRGDNVLAITGLNAALDDDDFFLIASLDGRRRPDAERDNELADSLRIDGDAAAARLQRMYLDARLLARRGKHRDAVQILTEVRERDATSLPPLCRLVESLRTVGDEARADEFLRAALDSEPPVVDDNFRRLFDAAWETLRRPHQGLEAYCHAALQARRTRELRLPVYVEPLTLVGIACYRLGLYGDAHEALSRAQSMWDLAHFGKSQPRNLAFLTMSKHRLGRHDEARKLFRKLRDPSKTTGWVSSDYILETARLVGLPLTDATVAPPRE